MAVFSGERALLHARSLSFPRKTGGAGWQKSREYIAMELKQLGFAVSEERFAIQWDLALFLKGVISLTLLLLVISYLISKNHPFVASLLMFVSCVLIFSTSDAWNALISSSNLPFKPRSYPGVNLVASLEPGRTTSKQILLVAHYDSKAQSLSLANRSFLLLCLFLLCLLVTLLYLTASFPGFPVLSPPTRKEMGFLSAITALCALLVYKNKTFDISPGGLDDASGVGTLMALAEVIREEPPLEANVNFLITDAEEDGLLGAWSYMKAHQGEFSPKTTYVVNLDGVGIEGRLMLTGKGRSELTTRLLALARARHIPLRRCFSPPGVLMDHMPFLWRGLKAVSLFTLSFKSLRIHTAKDTSDLLERGGLEETGELVLALIQQIDRRSDGVDLHPSGARAGNIGD